MDFLVKDWLFPIRCVGCGREDEKELLCQACLEQIKVNQTLFCGQCRARLPESKKICHRDFPYVLGVATDYDDKKVGELVSGLKFKFWTEAVKPLGKILTEYAKNLPLGWHETFVVPIPLSRQREKERGFNQSRMLAEVLAKNMRGVLSGENLARIRNAKPQSEMDFHKRSENVSGVFAVRDRNLFAGRKIILVDDVVTSGSTFLEAAKTVKDAGAKSVVALAVAGA